MNGIVIVNDKFIRYDCESPIFGKYGVTFLCSGIWMHLSYPQIRNIEINGVYNLELSVAAKV